MVQWTISSDERPELKRGAGAATWKPQISAFLTPCQFLIYR